MQRYFAKSYDKTLILEDSDIHHIKNVMRMKINDLIEAVYDNKLYICKIVSFEPFSLTIEKIIEEENSIGLDVTVAVGLVKEQKMDLILQKLTELGVKRIIPVNMERSIVRLDDSRFKKKKERWISTRTWEMNTGHYYGMNDPRANYIALGTFKSPVYGICTAFETSRDKSLKSDHGWCEVKKGKKWYVFDLTFGRRYPKKRLVDVPKTGKKKKRYQYKLKAKKNFVLSTSNGVATWR